MQQPTENGGWDRMRLDRLHLSLSSGGPRDQSGDVPLWGEQDQPQAVLLRRLRSQSVPFGWLE